MRRAQNVTLPLPEMDGWNSFRWSDKLRRFKLYVSPSHLTLFRSAWSRSAGSYFNCNVPNFTQKSSHVITRILGTFISFSSRIYFSSASVKKNIKTQSSRIVIRRSQRSTVINLRCTYSEQPHRSIIVIIISRIEAIKRGKTSQDAGKINLI